MYPREILEVGDYGDQFYDDTQTPDMQGKGEIKTLLVYLPYPGESDEDHAHAVSQEEA